MLNDDELHYISDLQPVNDVLYGSRCRRPTVTCQVTSFKSFNHLHNTVLKTLSKPHKDEAETHFLNVASFPKVMKYHKSSKEAIQYQYQININLQLNSKTIFCKISPFSFSK